MSSCEESSGRASWTTIYGDSPQIQPPDGRRTASPVHGSKLCESHMLRGALPLCLPLQNACDGFPANPLTATWPTRATVRQVTDTVEYCEGVIGENSRSEERRVGKECRSRWS